MTFEIVLQLVLNGLANGVLYALPALGISLIWNASGQFNFAQSDLLTLGGYIMFTLFGTLKIPYVPAFLLTVAVMGGVGYFLSWVYFYPMLEARVNPQIIMIGTVALSVFIRNFILVVWSSTPQRYRNVFGSRALQFGELFVMPHVLWIIGIVAALLILLQYFLRGTMMGTAMRSVAQRPAAAWLMGIRNNRMISITFMMSTAIAAVAGILIAPINTLSPSMGSTMGAKVMAAVLIGGLGSFSGALVGGILVGVSEILFSAFISSAYRDVFVFGLLVLFLIFRPGGIFKADISEKI
ncbi:MAG: branched-chain amino acid ABC transporter permease [Clostridiales bacterium]|nr:branched-chain amino acid ABC transporter permease [Clostridiales bacterium]